MEIFVHGLNYTTLGLFAPLLIVVGVLGFVLPGNKLLSNAGPYNIFHIVFGIIGLAFVLGHGLILIRGFNIGFGLIDLYQALASFMGWFPIKQFKLKKGDDVLHILIGGALVLIGVLGS